MINLLPHEEKRQLQAARTNTLLIRYNIFLLGVIGFMGIAIGITYIYLSSTFNTAAQTIQSNQANVVQYASVQAQAQLFRDRLSTAKQILDNEVTYSKVVLEIAQLIPSGVVLQTLSLDSGTFGTPTTLTGQAKDYASALALKDSFSKSPLFSDVHFQTIDTASGTGGYPVTVNLGITIKKDAAK
ncbi:MAG TPA: PilN domain-containing protein [Candidatus Chromulinivoraceae bacterium]|nr:PilN domain-containing protein [Candidatus Chromulinivoraceae bacterium]